MGRSTKKGPFVQPKLLERVIKMNENGEWEFLLTLGVVDTPTQNMTWNDDGEFIENLHTE